MKTLIVIGSRTAEDRYGIESGNRVAAELQGRNWNVSVLHAKDGKTVLRHLIDEAPELVVPVGFGPPCEDGHVAAAARLAGVPCAGPTPLSGGIMQDKAAFSRFVDALFPPGSGVRSPRGCVLTYGLRANQVLDRVSALRPPLLLKPSFSGSSEGLEIVDTHEAAAARAVALLPTERKILVQQLEQPIKHEISCTVLDGEGGPEFLPIVELRRDGEPVMGPEEKFGAEGLDRHIIPARLAPRLSSRVKDVVLRLHEAIGAVGLTRTDILILPDDELVLLEANGIPGLLKSSIACDAALAAGISFGELCVRYAKSAFLPKPELDIWGGVT